MQGEASTRLGFTDYFGVELAWAKLLGAALSLAPVPARLKEWAYAAFAITLGSALIAHLSIGEGPRRRGGWAAGTGRALADTHAIERPGTPLGVHECAEQLAVPVLHIARLLQSSLEKGFESLLRFRPRQRRRE